MWWLLLLLAIPVLICLMPLGLNARYDQSGLQLHLKIGFVRIPLSMDAKKKPHKSDKENVKKKAPAKDEEKENKKGGKLSDFIPLAKAVLDFLNNLRKQIVVKNLQLKLTLAGSDPCDLSVNYGRTWAAISGLQPHLNRFLRIRKQNIEVQCDFVAEQTTVFCYVDVSITLIRLLRLLLVHGTKIMDAYNNLKNQRKGGTDNESETSSNA